MTRIGVVGEALVDVLPEEGDRMVGRPGGSPANVAVALAGLGVEAHFLGRTSTDRWGARLRQHLDAAGVQVGGTVGDEPTAIAFVSLRADGSADYRFLWDGTADRQLTATGLTLALDELDAVHVGSVACVLEPAATAIAEAVAPIGDARVVSFDPNVRADLVTDEPADRARLLALAGHAHLVKASVEDLAFLFPDHDATSAARELLRGVRTHLAVVTHGEDGAELFTSQFQLAVAAGAPGPVVDTVGAGDTFMAALLAALAERDQLTVPAIRSLDAAAVRQVGRFAASAAGIVVTRSGAQPPRRDELTSPGRE